MALAIYAVAPYATRNSCQEMAGIANTHWRLIMLCGGLGITTNRFTTNPYTPKLFSSKATINRHH